VKVLFLVSYLPAFLIVCIVAFRGKSTRNRLFIGPGAPCCKARRLLGAGLLTPPHDDRALLGAGLLTPPPDPTVGLPFDRYFNQTPPPHSGTRRLLGAGRLTPPRDPTVGLPLIDTSIERQRRTQACGASRRRPRPPCRCS
jgi:hypothetical protein